MKELPIPQVSFNQPLGLMPSSTRGEPKVCEKAEAEARKDLDTQLIFMSLTLFRTESESIKILKITKA